MKHELTLDGRTWGLQEKKLWSEKAARGKSWQQNRISREVGDKDGLFKTIQEELKCDIQNQLEAEGEESGQR